MEVELRLVIQLENEGGVVKPVRIIKRLEHIHVLANVLFAIQIKKENAVAKQANIKLN
tara:strand:+ start:253 stop:426 length:174 start_codon:yes stop_codon:yes gene_type:complete